MNAHRALGRGGNGAGSVSAFDFFRVGNDVERFALRFVESHRFRDEERGREVSVEERFAGIRLGVGGNVEFEQVDAEFR